MKNKSIITQDDLTILEEPKGTSTDAQKDYVSRRLRAIEELMLQQNPTKVMERAIRETIIKLSEQYPDFDIFPVYKRLKEMYEQKGLQPKTEEMKALFTIIN